MSESTALALVEQSGIEKPSALMQRATDVAAVCKAAVVSQAMTIDKKKYVKVEGWNTIAAAYGCVPSIREVVEEQNGVRAVAELKRADGSIVASAEGYCGMDEPRWSNRPLYARRGMAQTRAISRVCRTAFAFVITLMDAGLETTPAEEIPHDGFDEHAVNAPRASPPKGNAGPEVERSKATQVRFGKSKGKYLCDIDERDLQWQLMAARKGVEANDPTWHEANTRWLRTVEAEFGRRGFAEVVP